MEVTVDRQYVFNVHCEGNNDKDQTIMTSLCCRPRTLLEPQKIHLLMQENMIKRL